MNDREQTEDTACRAEHLEDNVFQNIFDNAAEGIYRSTASPKGSFILANPALAHLFGCASVADFFATYSDVRYHFYADPLTRDDIAKRLEAHGIVQGYECRGRRKDGSTFWMLETARALYGRDGAVIGYEGFIQDISRRKAVEKRYRLVIEGANEGIWEWWSHSPRTYHVSDRFQEIVNISLHKNELPLNLWRDRIHPADLAHHDAEIDDFSKSGRATSAVEYRVRGDDGTYRWVLDRGCAERDEAQNIVHMAGSLGDVTAERTARQLLEESNRNLQDAKEAAEAADRAKSAFLATMSHELRTPLNAIIGFAEILRDERFGPHASPEYAEYSQDIYQSATYLLSIINDVLDLAKLESGTFDLNRDWYDLRNILDAAYRRVVPRARDKAIDLDVQLGDPVSLYVDRNRLQQVFANVLTNAVEFTLRGGRVAVSLERTPDGVTVVVRDTGAGMAAEDVPVAFQPFQQLDRGSTRDHAGCGLGLSLADKLTRMHGGSIEVDTEPGSGTEVRIHVPRSASE